MSNPYVRPMPRTWYLRTQPFRMFMIRELTSFFLAGYLVFLLVILARLGEGPEQYAALRETLRSPLSLVGHGLAFCAAVLAAVGIYGVVSNSVVQRTGEIGVRMALGADASRTVKMVVRQSLLVVAIGIVVGIGGALGASRFVEGLLYGVPPNDGLTFAVVAAGVVLIGTTAALIPARRAARVDPVVALREY